MARAWLNPGQSVAVTVNPDAAIGDSGHLRLARPLQYPRTMQADKFLARLAALDSLAATGHYNANEAAVAAVRAIQLRARGLLAYAVAVRNGFVARACAACLEGDESAAGAVFTTFEGVFSHPQGRAALLAALSAEGEA